MTRPRLRLAEPRFGDDALEAIGRVLASGNLTQGPVVAEFEAAVAAFCGVRARGGHDLGDDRAGARARRARRRARATRWSAADFTYPATGNAVLQRGATLRLVDVDPATYCIDPAALGGGADAADEGRASPSTSSACPADYRAIEPLLAERGIALICDAACSLGGAIGDRRTGTLRRAVVLLVPSAQVAHHGRGRDGRDRRRRARRRACGGCATTAPSATAGARRFVEPGFNYRLSRPQRRARAWCRCPRFGDVLARRRELAAALRERLARRSTASRRRRRPDGFAHPYQAFVVTCDAGARPRRADPRAARARRRVDARHLRDARRAELPARAAGRGRATCRARTRSPSARSRCRCTRAWPTRTSTTVAEALADVISEQRWHAEYQRTVRAKPSATRRAARSRPPRARGRDVGQQPADVARALRAVHDRVVGRAERGEQRAHHLDHAAPRCRARG